MSPTTVYIVNDDPSMRQALARLARSAGLHAEGFETVSDLLDSGRIAEPACVIADICTADLQGRERPRWLARQDPRPPVIFVTDYDTEQYREAARHAGAVAFFRKPVDGQALLDAITWAVEGTTKRTSSDG